MVTFLIALITGVAAGALTAQAIVRRELEKFRAGLPVPAPVFAPAPAPVAVAAPVAEPVAAAPAAAPPPVIAAPPIAVAPPPQEEIGPEILTVLTAAVAAFLGKRARIRSARPRGGLSASSAWAQQGRVFVQASHNLPVHR